MAPVALTKYLDTIRHNLRLDARAEGAIIRELRAHIEDKLADLKEKGLSEEEAIQACLRIMGSAKLIARQLYEAHSQGSWRQTLLAATPHLLFALLFTLVWWPGMAWLLGVLTLIFGAAIYGWWQERPTWFFTWLGYSLLPVVLSGLFLFYLPRAWSWVAIIVYIPLAAAIIYHVTIQTIRRDWLFSSLAMLPLPIAVAWFVAVGSEGSGWPSLDYMRYFGPWIGLSFLILAISVGFFIRMRQRRLKIALLLVSTLLTLTLVNYYAAGRLGLAAFVILIFVILGLFVTPAVLEHRIKHSKSSALS